MILSSRKLIERIKWARQCLPSVYNWIVIIIKKKKRMTIVIILIVSLILQREFTLFLSNGMVLFFRAKSIFFILRTGDDRSPSTNRIYSFFFLILFRLLFRSIPCLALHYFRIPHTHTHTPTDNGKNHWTLPTAFAYSLSLSLLLSIRIT